ncbi:MAG TPA: nicotinate-nucleotide adenylyltransferase [Bacteroidota bacterium]
MKTGIFGGTFDPPHTGHLIVAEHMREAAGLDRIIFVPSAISPHKQHQVTSSPTHRLAMLRLSIADHPPFAVSSSEIERGGISFTIDTLMNLREIFVDDALSLIIGMDNLVDFQEWKEPKKILEVAQLLVMTRPDVEAATSPSLPKGAFSVYPVPAIDLSSREIRRRVSEGLSVHYMVPPAVEAYIKNHQLYSSQKK